MDRTIEFRSFIEVRADPETAGFTGYAAHFWSSDSYFTAMSPGAFRKTIKERGDRLPVLFQHNPDIPVGRHRSIKEDKTGLSVDVELIDDAAEGSTLLKRLRGGVPLGLSFGFNTIKDRSAEDDDPIDVSQTPGLKKADVRVITEARLWETSVVTFPANERAAINDVRSHLHIQTITTLMDSLVAGTLTDEQTRAIEQLVAAYEQRAAAAAKHCTHDQGRPSFDYLAAAALTRARLLLGATA